MRIKTVTNLALAAGCALALAIPAAQAQMPTSVESNGPQVNPGDLGGGRAAARNVAESAQYDRLLETNRGFRQARMRKECGPITDPQLRANCLASFAEYESSPGASRPTMAGADTTMNPEYSASPQSSGTSGYGSSGPAYSEAYSGYGASSEPVPGTTGQSYAISRTSPAPGAQVPAPGAMPSYPGPRLGGPPNY